MLRRRGVMLSASDIEQIQVWEAAKVPMEVVCRALSDAAAAFRQLNGAEAELPRSLRYFANPVADAHKQWRNDQKLEPPEAPDTPDAIDVLAELAWIGRAETDERRRAAYRQAWRILRDSDKADLISALKHADQVCVAAFMQQLDPCEREALETNVEEGLDRAMSERARTLRRQARLEDLVSERYGLVRLTHSLTIR